MCSSDHHPMQRGGEDGEGPIAEKGAEEIHLIGGLWLNGLHLFSLELRRLGDDTGQTDGQNLFPMIGG